MTNWEDRRLLNQRKYVEYIENRKVECSYSHQATLLASKFTNWGYGYIQDDNQAYSGLILYSSIVTAAVISIIEW